MNISVFFPCYNEEENITNTVNQTVRVLDEIADSYEVLIIDDGSTDSTYEVASNLSKQNKNIKVIRHQHNLGYGAALCTGIKNSQFELICFMDSDGQFDFSEIKKFIPLIEKAPIVIGNRVNRNDPWHRRLNATMFMWLVRMIFGLKLKDLNCGFKLFRKEVLENVKLKSNGAFITSEILITARNRNYEFLEVPVNHYPRLKGKQTGANPMVVIKAFLELYIFYIRQFTNIWTKK